MSDDLQPIGPLEYLATMARNLTARVKGSALLEAYPDLANRVNILTIAGNKDEAPPRPGFDAGAKLYETYSWVHTVIDLLAKNFSSKLWR